MKEDNFAIEEVKSFKEYLACIDMFFHVSKKVKSIKNDVVLFRGQNIDNVLVPRIARMGLSRDLLLSEKQMLNEFKRQSVPYLNFKPETVWEWLALAQHYGLPTRLLDWAENPLAALWFCVSGPPGRDNSHGVVWGLYFAKQDFVGLDEEKGPFAQTRTRIFQPRCFTDRIIAQKGWFTVHNYSETEKRFVPLEENHEYRERIRKLTIPAEQFSQINDVLANYGVNVFSLFPGLDRLCELIKWREINAEKMGI
ncbi:MAG: FRG domain-containing protein [Candidatus Omnitrophica bacterium]|nr:FRG domain-containing protein [Candidatus Omnitrophota bacterium]